MTTKEIKRKNLMLIKYLESLNLNSNFKFKPEYSTDDNDEKVVVVQEQMGTKVVFYENTTPLFNYYSIQVFGISIQETKELMVDLGNLIGQSVRFSYVYTDESGNKYNELWQFIFMQFTNPQPIEYLDIRRVGYTATLKCVVNLVAKTQITEDSNEEE